MATAVTRDTGIGTDITVRGPIITVISRRPTITRSTITTMVTAGAMPNTDTGNATGTIATTAIDPVILIKGTIIGIEACITLRDGTRLGGWQAAT